MKVQFKTALSKVVSSTTTAMDSVSTKAQLIKDAHVVKSAMSDEAKEQAQVQAQMFKAMQAVVVHQQAEAVRSAKKAEKDAAQAIKDAEEAAKAGEKFTALYAKAAEKFTVPA